MIIPSRNKSTAHELLRAFNKYFETGIEVRLVSDTYWSSDYGIVAERKSDWTYLYKDFGNRLNEHFIPIDLLPDIENTPGNVMDEALKKYAKEHG